MDYGLYADTAEHRVDDPGSPRGGFRPSATLPDVDATTPATAFAAIRPDPDAMVVEDTGLIDRRTLSPGPGGSEPAEIRPQGGFVLEDTALHALSDTQPEMAHAVTEAAAIPPGLQGIDLGPPIGPTHPVPTQEVDSEEDTGQFEFAHTEAQPVPLSLRSLDLEATTDEVPIPHRTAAPDAPRKVIPPPPPSPEELGNAKTEAAEIPEFLRGIDLGSDD